MGTLNLLSQAYRPLEGNDFCDNLMEECAALSRDAKRELACPAFTHPQNFVGCHSVGWTALF